MITLKCGNTYSKDEFLKLVNRARITNKNSWIAISAFVDGNLVTYKAYKTWVQRMSVGGIVDSNCSDCSVKDYKQFLKDMLN